MATKQQVPKIAATLTEFQEGFEDLSTEDGQWVIQNGKEAVALCVKAVANRAKATIQTVTSILSDVILTFTVVPSTTEFVAEDKFKVDTSKKAKVKISYLGDNFKEWFLGKRENPFPSSTVCGRQLNKNLVDGPILVELGGQEKAETTLFELFIMMNRQANGESGALFNNGVANIFYVRDIKGILRAVGVGWDDGGWSVDAYSVESPYVWLAGLCVFSRGPKTIQLTE